MLFSYRYVNHSIEGFQVYLDHLVKEVWCKATGDFSLDLLLPELRGIVLEIYDTEEDTTRGKISDWLYGPIRTIYDLFKNLTAGQRQQISKWYDNNNDIEALCACDPHKLPTTYTDIRGINADLEIALKDFYKSLFTDVIHLKAVTSRIGEIDAHYSAFLTENEEDKCPYCGYGRIEGRHGTMREAYDHFLPKSIYPFNSINFHNLAPMCNKCNSSYKLAKDPTKHIDPISRKVTAVRRKAFYSYAGVDPDITITVTLKTKDIRNLEPKNIDLNLSATGCTEQVEAWKDVFGIVDRYKEMLCRKNDGKAWFARVQDECQNYDKTPEQMLAAEIRSAESTPWSDANFLKKPFLLACQDANVISSD